MTLQARLEHTCVVKRDANPVDARDEGGYPLRPGVATGDYDGWQQHRSAVPCYLWRAVPGDERNTMAASTAIKRPMMLLPLIVDGEPNDIKRHDLVTDVRDRDGRLLAQDLEVADVDATLKTHIEVTFVEVAP